MEINFIGIDLGTTYSCVGVRRDKKVEIIANEHGNRITPSYVSFNGNERYIGESAKDDLQRNGKNTIYDVKRLIGKKISDKSVKDDMEHLSYNIVGGKNDSCMVEVEYMNEKKHFYPEEISAMILEKLKQVAENYTGNKIVNAVITVPAYFNDSQRQATRDAGTIAGLNVLRIINEPTSAAIAYNLETKHENRERNVVVYDLGGGTLDITILKTNGGVLDIISTNGNTHLGGEDFDMKIVDYCIHDFIKKNLKPSVLLMSKDILELTKLFEITNIRQLYGISNSDIIRKIDSIENDKYKTYLKEVLDIKVEIFEKLMSNKGLVCKLKKQCENAKKILSSNNKTTINVDNFYLYKNNWLNISCDITREIFESICSNEFKLSMEPLQQALDDANIAPVNIDDVVLIGGSTRIPKIQSLLKEIFGDKLRKDINPDEAVAYGATVQAALLSGQNDANIRDLVLSDICPLSLGVETSGGIMSSIIKRNTAIPCSHTVIYSTYVDNQPGVSIKVYQGERSLTKDNELLGSFDLNDIPPMPAKVPKIAVTFSIDMDGILSISAIEQSSKIKNDLVVKDNKTRLSDEEIAKKIEDAEKYILNDKKQKESIESKMNLDSFLKTLLTKIDDSEFQTVMGEELYMSFYDKIIETNEKLETNINEPKEYYDDLYKNIEELSKNIFDEYNIKR